ncbi:type I-B CRISPR-associated endonuclease Cas1b [Clostridium septicum]|uniref:CRISPR-associated endonuclease Cas1 n=1 Tax=Clostridium septicum TaxID=1504 RepID=A0A9N7PI04_CLOSE|nr:type I-B CRISPR-associated endonuclease Cas1b [Clostridium septicum]AYE33255.1 subtype I-B CRISPR-associated endonuclease Cas1 [Clostridium septicum]MDU1313015.1 type I-B CRISPR-associated endonuclease Cas1b [Clostridium septicum]QAS61426.1 type I-B CRISPR-associated endonuclease Cas1 [Clostridium septicum]UEC22143.1 type I-B CRISPR-associated endonuclease Cas1b [Clostridium septicum]USR99827.1 type I-B CRISPR-associated endonuclease Cas1b [Clostridium septicum]
MGKDYYVFSPGRIKRKDNTIYFINTDEEKRGIPIESIERIHFFSEVDLNSKFINYISQYKIILNFYNYYGFYSGSYYPRKKNVSGFLLVEQAVAYKDLESRLFLAKAFIDSAIHHILRNMRRYDKVPNEYFEKIAEEKERMLKANSIPEIMGAEGRIRKIYYESYQYILKNDFGFTNRNRRPPKDPLNALISFGNSVMYTAILGEVYQTQLDPTISYLHEPSTKRFSLILDISEIFKPLIIDTIIFSLINNRRLNNKDFTNEEGVCFLNDEGKKKFLTEFEKKMATSIKHRKLKRSVSYRQLIKLEGYKIIKHLINDEKYKPLKAWW